VVELHALLSCCRGPNWPSVGSAHRTTARWAWAAAGAGRPAVSACGFHGAPGPLWARPACGPGRTWPLDPPPPALPPRPSGRRTR